MQIKPTCLDNILNCWTFLGLLLAKKKFFGGGNLFPFAPTHHLIHA